MLRATSEINVRDADALLGRLCEHFAEHGDVVHAGGEGRVSFGYGSAVLKADAEGLRVAVEAGTEIHLSYMKMGVVEHVLDMAEGPVAEIHWQGDGLFGGVPLFFREMRVVSSRRLTPHMQRVRLSGEDLARFGDDGLHVHLVFPPKGRAPVWPILGADGRIVWPQGEDILQRRVYTLRRVNPVEGWVEIDLVLHEGGDMPGAVFAETAQPGDIVGMTGPGGGGVPDGDALFLFGDETALPAIARIIEELPAHARAKAVIEIDGPADEIDMPSKASVEIRYLHRNGAPAGTLGLLAAAVREADLESLGPEGFVWVGCEFADFRAIRAYLRKELKMPKDQHRAAAYWRRGTAGDEARREA